MKKTLYAGLVVVVALFGLTFSYKNHHTIEIDYYFGIHFQAVLSLLLFAAFALGLLIGCLATLRHVLTARRKLARAKRDLHELQGAKQPSSDPVAPVQSSE